MKNALVAENIFVSIGNKDILKGVTIRCTQGTITGLLGRNGAGKSTMLKVIFGTQPAQERSIFVNDKIIRQPLYTKNSIVNYLPSQKFFPHTLVVKKALQQFDVDEDILLQYFPELEKDLDRRMFELSGGRERLLSAAVLIMADTQFTLLDEPFSHIMPIHVEQLMLLIQLYKEKKGFIITDHIYGSVLHMCDSLCLMKEGKTIAIKHASDLALHGYLQEDIAL